jgi:hypothetical protein
MHVFIWKLKIYFKIFLLLFLLPSLADAQFLENYVAGHYSALAKQKKFEASGFYPVVANTDYKAILNRIIGADSINLFWKNFTASDFDANFCFVDYDHDKDQDLVFNGYTNGESEDLILFENEGGMYQCRLRTYGRLVKIKEGDGFLIYQYPCCADIQNTFIYYRIQKDTLIEDWGLVFFNSPLLKGETKDYDNIMPEKVKPRQTIQLPAGAEINIVPSDSLLHPTYIKRPKLDTLCKAVSVRVFGSFRDAKGARWCYCKIPPDGMSPYNANLKYPFFAWVKMQ